MQARNYIGFEGEGVVMHHIPHHTYPADVEHGQAHDPGQDHTDEHQRQQPKQGGGYPVHELDVQR